MLKFEITLEFYQLGVMMYGSIDLKWCSCGVADMQLAIGSGPRDSRALPRSSEAYTITSPSISGKVVGQGLWL
jgi:hypothetical protein